MSAGSCSRVHRPGRDSSEHRPAVSVERLEPRRLLSGGRPGGAARPRSA
jgi:hypothetical protein